jgi:hypothetical protein
MPLILKGFTRRAAMKVQCNLLIDEELKDKAKKMIKKYRGRVGQPFNLSDLVNTMLWWYVEADEGKADA